MSLLLLLTIWTLPDSRFVSGEQAIRLVAAAHVCAYRGGVPVQTCVALAYVESRLGLGGQDRPIIKGPWQVSCRHWGSCWALEHSWLANGWAAGNAIAYNRSRCGRAWANCYNGSGVNADFAALVHRAERKLERAARRMGRGR